MLSKLSKSYLSIAAANKQATVALLTGAKPNIPVSQYHTVNKAKSTAAVVQV